MLRSLSSLTRVRIVVTVGLLLSIFITAGFAWSTLAIARGSDTVAEIVKVEHRGEKKMLTVRFAAGGGQQCESYFRLFPDRPATEVGDRIPVRYPSGNPCINVREVDKRMPWAIVVFAGLMTVGLAVGARLAWRPQEIPPPRYADMP